MGKSRSEATSGEEGPDNRKEVPRILQLVSLAHGSSDSRGAGGPEIRTAEALRFWDAAKVHVIVAYSSLGRIAARFREYPHWIDFVVTNRRRLRTFIKLLTIISSHKVDLIHTQGPVYTDFVATLAARIKGIGNVVTRAVQISEFTCSPIRRLLFLWMDHYTKSRCRVMVAISRGGAEILRSEGCESSKIALVYNGVDTVRFSPRVPPSQPRATIGELHIGMFAQMVPHKRHDILIAALEQALAQGRRWRLFLIGDGPERERLQEQARAAAIAHAVEFLGFQLDLAPLYTSMDIVALASEREGLPVTLLEGMAAGRACVASRVAAVEEVIEEGTSGQIVGENTPAAFFRTIAALDDNRPLLVRMGSEGRRIAEARFSIQQMVDGYQRIYTGGR